MGYMRHHTIIVTTWKEALAQEIRERCIQIVREAAARDAFTALVSSLVPSPLNGYISFFVAPDGSKEGWPDSDAGDQMRERIIETLDYYRHVDGSSPIAWAELQYGDDEHITAITRHSDEPERKWGEGIE